MAPQPSATVGATGPWTVVGCTPFGCTAAWYVVGCTAGGSSCCTAGWYLVACAEDCTDDWTAVSGRAGCGSVRGPFGGLVVAS